jgi:hypothetical protein
MEDRGMIYTVGSTLMHERLDPNKNDLFIHHIGYDAQGGAYPFAMGRALENIDIDVHIINGLGHDATVDGSFYVYYSAGTISNVSGFAATGTGTNWKTTWPGNEWEFKLDGDLDGAWTPVNSWNAKSQSLSLAFTYLGSGISGPYKIRMPVPPINVLIVHHHPTLISPWGALDGSISFNANLTLEPGPENPQGNRYWSWSGKAISVPKSSSKFYGLAITLKTAIDNYFDQMPYMNGTTWMGTEWENPTGTVLEPLCECEDYGDNASAGSESLDIKTYDGAGYSFWMETVSGALDQVHILRDNRTNEMWDGDRRLENKIDWGKRGVSGGKGNLTPFDIDNDGLVELPFATDPKTDNSASQFDDEGFGYSKARVTQFLATHEIGHALAGSNHSDVSACTMFKLSNNWKRDHYLSDQVRENVEVHNYMRGF